MAISGSIKPLKDKNGNYIFPETSSEAVYCSDGMNIEQKMIQSMSSINTDITNLKQKNTEFSSRLEQVNFIEENKLKFVYGVKGDGINDDTEALQRAINDIKNNGYGTLFLNSNMKIKITKSLELPSNITIDGSGTIFTDIGEKNNGLNMIVAFQQSNIVIKNIHLIGNVFGEDFPPTGEFTGMGVPLLLVACDNVKILNTIVEKGGGTIHEDSDINQGVGNIYISSCSNVLIEGNTITKSQNGIVVDDWYSKLEENKHFYTKNIIITNNILYNGQGRAICVDVDKRDKVNNIIVCDNTISDYAYSGIDFKGCTGGSVINNCIDCSCSNRTWGNGYLIPTLNGIIVTFGTTDLIIDNNQIYGVYRCGIDLQGSNVTISKNIIKMNNSENSESPNNILITCNNTIDLKTIKILDNVLENTGINSNNGNNICCNMNELSIPASFIINNNTIIGKGKGIAFFNATNLDLLEINYNTFTDNGIFKLVSIYVDSGNQINITNNRANKVLKFFFGTSDKIIFDNNKLRMITNPYTFNGNISLLKTSDLYESAVTTYIYDTANATIENSDCRNITLLKTDISKFKNSKHPMKYMAYSNDKYSVGTWAEGDLIYNISPSSGNPRGWIYSNNQWISIGNL